MKASIAHGIRPSALILGKDSGKRWSKIDITLAKAYQRYLGELCPQCGLPKYICHTDDNRISFKLGKDSCASAARAEKENKRMADDQKTDYFGLKVFGVPELLPGAVAAGMELSDFRRPYLIDEMKKAGLIPEE